jgi:hypothetical protein
MTTWAEWFAYLDGRLDASIGGQLPEIDEFIRGNRQCQAERGLVLRGSRAPVLDELSATNLFLDQLVQSAAESHYLAASQLFSQGRGTSWLPAALPNSQESRLVKRAVTASRRGEPPSGR